MMTYFIRSVKYFVAMTAFCLALMALMILSGASVLSFGDTLYVMFHTPRFLALFGALVVLAALYPRFGFVRRRVEGDLVADRIRIVNAFASAGFSLCSETDETLTFRAEGFLLRSMLLFEDRIAVSQYGQWILLDGIRRGVARVAYRLDSSIRMAKRNE